MNPTKQNPFSIYDFLGYFVPGAFAIYILFIIRALKVANPETDKIQVVLDKLAELKPEYIIPFLIIAYILGHLLSYVSSITIEQYANWKYNYPSRYLLNIDRHKKGILATSKDTKSKILRGIMIVFIIPIFISDLILGNYFRFNRFFIKKLDDVLISLIKTKSKKLFKILGSTKDKS